MASAEAREDADEDEEQGDTHESSYTIVYAVRVSCRLMLLVLLASCATEDAPECLATEMEWGVSVLEVGPERSCTTDEECVLVPTHLICERDGERWAEFHQGCDLPGNRADVDRFIADRDRLAAELCDSLREPLCVVTSCNVDGGFPGVRCVGGRCTKR